MAMTYIGGFRFYLSMRYNRSEFCVNSAPGFYLLLKKLHYEDVNGDQDKSADEQSIMEAHMDFERSVKNWTPQFSRQSQMPWAQQARMRDAPEPLRLYRLSGLDGYKQKTDQEGVMEEGRANDMMNQRLETVREF